MADYFTGIGIVPYIVMLVLGFFARVWSALTASYSLPGWALLVLLASGAFSLVCVLLIMRDYFGEPEPEHKAYVEDFLFNVKWQWEWNGNNITSLGCLCPHCEGVLVVQEPGQLEESNVRFICEHCNYAVKAMIPGRRKHYALDVVKRAIDRKIRTGEYKKNE